MLSGFPWQLLGYSQYLNLPLLQWAAITGVYGLSFLIVLFNAALAQALSHRAFIPYLGLPLFLLVAVHLWGFYRLHDVRGFATLHPEGRASSKAIFPKTAKWKENRLALDDSALRHTHPGLGGRGKTSADHLPRDGPAALFWRPLVLDLCRFDNRP